MLVSQILARYLHDVGVRHIFGVSAHSLFDITDAIYQQPGLEFVPAQVETAASYMATAYARARRDLAVLLVSEGAGATNALTGVAQAYKESTPVLVISSEVELSHLDKGRASWFGIPHTEIYRPITKLAVTLERGEDILSLLQEAVATATSGRKGPVFVGIPRELEVAEVDAPRRPGSNPRPRRPGGTRR